jgi:hypothetical protein
MFKGAVKLFGVLLSICGLCTPSALVTCRFSKWLDALNIIARLALVTAYSATHLFTPATISEPKTITYQVSGKIFYFSGVHLIKFELKIHFPQTNLIYYQRSWQRLHHTNKYLKEVLNTIIISFTGCAYFNATCLNGALRSSIGIITCARTLRGQNFTSDAFELTISNCFDSIANLRLLNQQLRFHLAQPVPINVRVPCDLHFPVIDQF